MLSYGMRRRLQSAAHLLGYEIHRYSLPEATYAEVHPSATYSPWSADAAFLAAFRRVRAHTLVDEYRCFELWSLVEQSGKREGALLEVGVWRGGTGALIAQRARLSGIRDKVYLCDTFSGVVKASAKDSTYKGGEHDDTSLQTVESLLQALGLENAVCLKGVFPEETGRSIEDAKIRFCHIDVDVYGSAKDVTEWVWPRLCIGGVVVYDDYGFKTCDGVTRYVEEQFPLADREVIHNLNGHAVVVKTSA